MSIDYPQPLQLSLASERKIERRVTQGNEGNASGGWGGETNEVSQTKNREIVDIFAKSGFIFHGTHPHPTQSRFPFGAGVQFSRYSIRAFSDGIKILENRENCEQSTWPHFCREGLYRQLLFFQNVLEHSEVLGTVDT